MTDYAHVLIDYPPQCRPRYGTGTGSPGPHERIAAILRTNAQEQIDVAREIAARAEDFRSIPFSVPNDDHTGPIWNQPWFPPYDGMALATLLARHNPARYLEIGSGNSTRFARWATETYGLRTHITSIDPEPRAEIDALCDHVERAPLEACDLAIFGKLEAGDLLFFDGSHRSFMNSDVTVFFMEVLPELPPGVIVGMHDVFWPDDYPEAWNNRYYNEQYMLGVHILALGPRFQAVFPCTGVPGEAHALIQEALGEAFWNSCEYPGGGSMWWRTHNPSI
ncbi:MAG: class I SAM-dependent methyltransferase [Planctomycetota bacterium]